MLPLVVLATTLVACEEDYDRRCDFGRDGSGESSPLIRFSRPGGLFDWPFSLEVDAARAGTLRYTINGCPPDEDSAVLDEPLTIDRTMEVRVALFDADTQSPPRASHSYIEIDPQLSFDSNLPLVVVETWGQPGLEDIEEREHLPATMVIVEPGDDGRVRLTDPPAFVGRVGMHIRGNSSAEQYPKKQYKVETWDEFDDDLDRAVLGMPAEADWVLHAPHSDKTFMRNHLVYRWSNRVGRWAPRTRMVECFIDRGDRLTASDYVGVYVWMDEIEVGADRVDVAKLSARDASEPQVSGGYLLARDWDSEEHGIRTEVYDDAILVEYPRREDATTEQRRWISGYLDEFERALSGSSFGDPEQGYARYIDVESFIDHHLLVELARDVDGFVLSTYMHKDREGLLHMGPVWDFNGALGNADYFEAWDPEGWHHENPDFPEDNPHGYRWYARLFEDPDFSLRYAMRWQELRAGPLSNEALLADIDEGSTLLQEAAERNFERWPILGRYVWPNDEGHDERTTYAQEVDYLRTWLLARLSWVDEQLR